MTQTTTTPTSPSETKHYEGRNTTPTKNSNKSSGKKLFSKTPPKKTPPSHNIKSFFPPAAPLRDFVILLDDLNLPPRQDGKEKDKDVEKYKLTTTKTTTTTTTTIIENFFTPISPNKKHQHIADENIDSEDEKRDNKKKKKNEDKYLFKKVSKAQGARKDADKVSMHIDSFFRTVTEEKTSLVRDVSVSIPALNKMRQRVDTNSKVTGEESEEESGDFDYAVVEDMAGDSEDNTENHEERRRNSFGGTSSKTITEEKKTRRRKSAPRIGPNAKRKGREERQRREERQYEVVKELLQGADGKATTDKTKKMTFPPAVDEDGHIVCLFCRKREEETTCEGKLMHDQRLNIHIHFDCLYSSSRAKNESVTQMVYRIAGKGRQTLACKLCNKKLASLGCNVKTCAKIYHYKCGIDAEGKWDPVTWMFFCKDHYAMHNQEMIPVYKAAVKWPRDCKVDFRRENIWDEIKQEHRDIIARFARVEGPETKKEKKKGNSEEHFEYDEDEDEDEDDEEEEEDEGEDDKAEDRNWTRAWEGQSFITRTVIRQIGPGHWAWCPDLSTGKSKPQYEAIAAEDINKDDFIGEYVGRVRYENQHTLRNPYVTSMFVPSHPSLRSLLGPSFSGLCIDSSQEGNETRFINSVTRHSPPHVRQNATMDTVWCRGALRVIIRSIRKIRQGEPIVLNYDEYIKADGSHPYFDSDSDSENESQREYVPYIVNNVLIPKSTVVIPYIREPPKK